MLHGLNAQPHASPITKNARPSTASDSPAPDDGDDSEVPSLHQTSQGRAFHGLEQLGARRAAQSGGRMHVAIAAPTTVRVPIVR